MRWRRPGVWVALALVLASSARLASAAGVVGDGTPESCTEAAFAAALMGGGSVTFACGPASHTIVLTAQQTITSDTSIDASDDVILSGADLVRPLAVAAGVTLALRDIQIEQGNAATDGGCIHNAGTLTITSSTLTDCAAGRDGGALFNDTNATLQLVGSLILGNVATRHGGGIYDAGTSVSLSGSTVSGNDAGEDGGGVYVTGAFSAAGALVTLNTAQRGAGIFVAGGSATLSSTTVSGNTAPVSGGGIHNAAGAMLDVTSGEIRNNTNAAGGSLLGAGLYNEGTAALSRVTLRTNAATQGGGVYQAGGTLEVVDTTISANIASSGGGMTATAPATLTNSTLSGNLGNFGAALESTADVSLQNVTVADNIAQTNPPGSALSRTAGTLSLRNTLVALNSPADCQGVITSAGNNLAGDASCVLIQPGDIENVAPQIGLLQFNGGLTRTHLPSLGSPAVDAGTADGCPANDQRGHTRPVGASCDIGAVERQEGDPTPTTSTVTSTSTSTTASPSSSTSTTVTSTTSTSDVPTTSTSVTSTTSTSEVPTTSTSVTSTTSTSEVPTTSTSVTSTTSTSEVPTTSTSVTSTTSTSEVPTTSTSVTSTTSTSDAPTTSTSVTSTTSTSTTAPSTTTSSTTTSSTVETSTTTTAPSSTTTTETSATTVTSTVTSTSLPGGEICFNGIDDDGDTLADCVDPDCATAAACPDACGTIAGFAVLRCRLTALAMRTAAATDQEPFASDVQAVLEKAAASAGGAEIACDEGDRRAAKRSLKRLGKRATRYRRKVGAKRGREAIPEQQMRDRLRNDAVAIRLMSKALRKDVDCRPGP